MSSTKVLVTNEYPAAQYNPFSDETWLGRAKRFAIVMQEHTQTRGKNDRKNSRTRRKTESR
tara:strand:+ start:505 stop:687 length:183 start_codon:yes stop_codon:yes gene_type:complete